ncbi:unnamed protein product, partial [Iphiclides podalirius]
MKIVAAFALFLASTLAEPPVNNQYLPPQDLGGSVPSRSYGAPGFGGQRQTDAIFRGRPSSTYGAPGQRSNARRPSSQYGAPSALYSSPRSSMSADFGYQRPATQYGAPAIPSQSYGTPGLGAGFGSAQSGDSGAQSRQYLPPGGNGYSGGDGSNGEPANYSFEYMVKDDASGNDFGHRESRQGDRAEGLYYVLLPDGRKQTVEYEADQNGYKPRISYEDVGSGFGGYGRNGQGGYSGGYPSQEGPY